MVHLQRAVEMSRFENRKNCNISDNHITVVILPYIANVTISKETKGLCIVFFNLELRLFSIDNCWF